MLQHPKMFSNDKSIESKHHTHTTRESNCFSIQSTSSEKQHSKMFQCNIGVSEIRGGRNNTNVYSEKLHPGTVKHKKTTISDIIITGSRYPKT